MAWFAGAGSGAATAVIARDPPAACPMTSVLPALLVGFAAWFVVPRGLGLLGGSVRSTAVPALLLTLGLVAPHGIGAAALTVPWCVVVTAAALSVVRTRLHTRDRFDAVVAVASVAFLAVGAGWATLAAVGADPVQAGGVIVILTAAHFHYAGLAFGVIAARTRREGPKGAVDVATLLWLAGVPAVALTIATHSTNPIGPLVLTGGGIGVGAALLRAARAHRSAGLATAGASILAGITLAAGYALSMQFGFPWLSVAMMERTHGVLNAIGFATVGVARVDGGRSHHRASTRRGDDVRFSVTRPSPDALARIRDETHSRAAHLRRDRRDARRTAPPRLVPRRARGRRRPR